MPPSREATGGFEYFALNDRQNAVTPPNAGIEEESKSQEQSTMDRAPLAGQKYDSPVGIKSKENGQHPPRKRTGPGVRSWTDRFWLMEMLSCLIAIASFAAIVITLVIHQDRPLPQWPHLITINTLIALFTSILKASMIMPVAEGISELKWIWFHKPRTLADMDKLDFASRGPWGSLCLLLSMNRNYLAALGAIITIVAMAVDPFSQQILQYYTCLEPLHSATTSIPGTNNYTGNAFHSGAALHEIDADMSIAIYTGLLSPPANSSSSMTISCLTGNCTYPSDNGATFSTLAISHSCEDISNLILNVTDNSSSVAQTPGGAQLALPNDGRIMNTISTYGDDIIYGFESLMLEESGKHFAFNCSLFPSINAYGSSVKDSIYNETLLSSVRVHRFPYEETEVGNPSAQPLFSATGNSTLRNGTRYECIPSDHRMDTNTSPVDAAGFSAGFLATSLWDGKTNFTWYPVDCVWAMEWSGANAIQIFLTSLFSESSFSGSNLTISGSDYSHTMGQTWLKLLFHNGHADMNSVNKYMSSLAISMSAAVRQHGDTLSSDFVQGTVLSSQTCIRVRWAWISLPATLLLLTIIFLALTVVQTARKSWQGTWKSSAIGLLFHGFDADTRKAFGTGVDRSELNKISEHVQVQLQYDGGWTFSEKKK